MPTILITMQHHLMTQAQSLGLADRGLVPVMLCDRDPGLYAALCTCPVDPAAVTELAGRLANVITQFGAVLLPIGSAALHYELGRILSGSDVVAYYAHTRRVCSEELLPDGSVRKTYVLRHEYLRS